MRVITVESVAGLKALHLGHKAGLGAKTVLFLQVARAASPPATASAAKLLDVDPDLAYAAKAYAKPS